MEPPTPSIHVQSEDEAKKSGEQNQVKSQKATEIPTASSEP